MKKVHAQGSEREQGGRLTLGVQVAGNAVRVVEAAHGQVTGWVSVPIVAGQSVASPDFPRVIHRALEPFDVHRRQARLWVMGSLSSLQLRFLSVPKARVSQLSHMVYWTFRKEIPFDASLTVFDYDTEGESVDGGSHKVDVTAYTVLQTDVDRLITPFGQAGYPVDGVVIPHFAMRNLIRARWLNHAETVLCLYVGDESSSLLILKSGRVMLSRVFITGMNAVLDALRDRHPEWTREALLATLRQPDGGEEADRLRNTMRAALGRLMQQVERSMAAYLVGRSGESIAAIHVLGSIAGLPRVVEDMGVQWGIPAYPAHLLESANMAPGAVVPDASESAELTMAAGVALSHPMHTPSVLYTYVRRQKAHRKSRTRAWAVAAVVLVLLSLLAAYVGLERINAGREKEWTVLRAQVAQFDPALNRAMIDQLLQDAECRHRRLRQAAQNSRPLAVVHQLARATPQDIRLTRIHVGRIPSAAGLRPGEPVEKVSVSGLVQGLPETQESKLASYVIRLEDTPLFQTVSVKKSVEGRERGDHVLLFDMEWALVPPVDRAPPQTVVAAKEGL